jgi:hypothetical protein
VRQAPDTRQGDGQGGRRGPDRSGGRFPVPEADIDKMVAILERLSAECSEAAGMLQHSVPRKVVTPSVAGDVATVPEQDRRR